MSANVTNIFHSSDQMVCLFKQDECLAPAGV